MKKGRQEMCILEAIGLIDDKYIEEAAPLLDAVLTKSKKRHLAVIIIAAALTAVMVGCGVVMASYGDNIQHWFVHYWELVNGHSMSDEHKTLIDHLSQNINISRTIGEVTVTVDSAAVGDDNFCLLLRVEGEKFSKRFDYGFTQYSLLISPDPLENTGGMAGYGMQCLGVDEDGAMLLMLDYEYVLTEEFIASGVPLEVILRLENLSRSPYTDRKLLLEEGLWQFGFSIDPSHSLEVLHLPDTLVMAVDLSQRDTFSEEEVMITDIELTSTGLRFQYDYQYGRMDISSHDVKLILQNGTEIGSSGGVGSPLKSNNSILNWSWRWDVPVNLSEVEAVEIGGSRIPVADNKEERRAA